MKEEVTPNIYVACLAAYNNGYLHGKWIDASLEPESILSEIFKMLAASPIKHAEEWAIHDYEGFGPISLSEYESIDTVSQYTHFISSHGELGAALVADFGLEEAENMLENHYHGEFEDEIEFATSLFEDCYGTNLLPANLQGYFDYEKFAHDLFICDYFSITSQGKIHVFSNY